MNSNNILLGILMVAVFVTGFMVGRMSNGSDMYVLDGNKASTTKETTTGTVKTGSSPSSTTGTPVAATQMTDDQRKMLTAMGIDPNTVTITPQMIACAEASVGASRVAEIKNGATPSFTEGVKLVACYK